MISPYIQELHLLLLVPFLTQRWLLALGGVGGPVVLLHGFHLGWLRLCGERYRAKRSGDQRRHGTLKGCPSSIFRYLQMIQARIHVKCVLGSSFEHHKIAVSCAIRTNLTFDLKMGTSHDPPKLEGPRGGWLKHKPTSPHSHTAIPCWGMPCVLPHAMATFHQIASRPGQRLGWFPWENLRGNTAFAGFSHQIQYMTVHYYRIVQFTRGCFL